jgi:hypothetical protein
LILCLSALRTATTKSPMIPPSNPMFQTPLFSRTSPCYPSVIELDPLNLTFGQRSHRLKHKALYALIPTLFYTRCTSCT